MDLHTSRFCRRRLPVVLVKMKPLGKNLAFLVRLDENSCYLSARCSFRPGILIPLSQVVREPSSSDHVHQAGQGSGTTPSVEKCGNTTACMLPQGEVRIGPDLATNPALHVTREMEDLGEKPCDASPSSASCASRITLPGPRGPR